MKTCALCKSSRAKLPGEDDNSSYDGLWLKNHTGSGYVWICERCESVRSVECCEGCEELYVSEALQAGVCEDCRNANETERFWATLARDIAREQVPSGPQRNPVVDLSGW